MLSFWFFWKYGSAKYDEPFELTGLYWCHHLCHQSKPAVTKNRLGKVLLPSNSPPGSAPDGCPTAGWPEVHSIKDLYKIYVAVTVNQITYFFEYKHAQQSQHKWRHADITHRTERRVSSAWRTPRSIVATRTDNMPWVHDTSQHCRPYKQEQTSYEIHPDHTQTTSRYCASIEPLNYDLQL